MSSKNGSIRTCDFSSFVNNFITLNCQHLFNRFTNSVKRSSKIICQLKIRMWMFVLQFNIIERGNDIHKHEAIRWKRVETIKVNEF